ncbi:MAG: enoyl-CoA hydratase [Chloroflexi bacterium]|nr:enoyl-CoA hydratase [Chloroflexota bacterium]
MGYEYLLVKQEERVTTITLNQPDNLNPVSPPLVAELVDAVTAVQRDPAVRVLVLTGAGRAFSAGGDVKTMPDRIAMPLPERRQQILDLANVVLRLQQLEKPVIAMINGPAVGAGCNLALACDIRIASEAATFGEVFVRIGLMPDFGGAYFLPRLVGTAKACELIFTGDIIDAKEAYRIGMVNKLVLPEELEKTTMDMARKLAQGPAVAIGMAKFAIYKGLEMNLASYLDLEALGQAIVSKTDDIREGLAAFLEKRKPHFEGR